MKRGAAWRAAWLLALCLLASPAQAEPRALLVGVGEYPALPGRRLEGPANDVRLMLRSLSALGFDAAQVQVLAEQGDALPTRDNILQGLAQLARKSRPGDWVLLYFSGHGAQVPAAKGARLDEVFLPRDTALWDPHSKQVRGALRDKELAAAMQRIRAQGAHVWAVFDTCHAADMLRGPSRGPLQGLRFVSPPELRIPIGLWLAGRSLASSSPLRSSSHHAGASMGRYVGFFAAGKDEGSLEEWLPDPLGSGASARYGVFTWELARALRGRQGDFAQLGERIAKAYQERPFPTPEFVGALEQGLPGR